MSDLRSTLLPIFFDEAESSLKTLAAFLDAETPGEDALEEAVRAAHTVKGAAALVKLENIGSLASDMERALDALSVDPAGVPEELFPALREAFSLLQTYCELARSDASPSEDLMLRTTSVFAPLDRWIDERLAVSRSAEEGAEEPLRPEYVCCTFSWQGRGYCLPVEDMVEITDPVRLTALPLSPSYVPGIMVHRGEAVAVINLAHLEGEPESSYRPPSADWMVVAHRGGQRLAFLAEGVPSLSTEYRGEPIDMGEFLHRYRLGAA